MTPKELGALPAMPTAGDYRGLTIRQQFAMTFMAAYRTGYTTEIAEVVASWAVFDADTLLAELCKDKP